MKNVIASVTKQSIFLTFSILLALLAACGDESSSSVSPEPGDDSSSSVIPASSDDDLSSSSQKSSGEEKSSSSEKNAKESSSSATNKNSSSSVSGDKSSSSVKKEDSSSSVVKSSSSDDAPKSSSSEESKNSSAASSSSAKSSSSFDINAPCPEGDFKRYQGVVYECVDGSWTKYEYSSSSSTPKSSSSQGYKSLPNPLRYNMSYGEFTDTRDGTKYATIDIDNEYGPDSVHLAFTAFAQNLKYHEKMVAGTEEQEDDTKVEMYCYNDSIEYCNDWWGGLYQWAEMMALPYECNSKSCADLIDPDGNGFHQGICPSGWHVMTERELLAASYTSGGDKYLDNRMSSLASEISYSLKFGINTSGMSFIAAGYRDGEENAFAYLKESAVVDYPEESPSEVVSTIAGGVSKYMTLLMGNLKTSGVSVRCVKDY